ncbi:hypothetical protein MMH89_01160 [Candidatus Comchoanobacter bicostacola]|uniref:Uncharacterized protein n=1 Tax=Candidatus Comchoanobacter bicostacola TaxID=2919598 RepID=A0ABY5DM55_9GAMM|nr:hypothetical protein [Candidatus Comchoanobacter bicostacola]UTC24762.1 hypothetical protein MMH89_01160 [Candidatus Comchoanobacter bicostacola]
MSRNWPSLSITTPVFSLAINAHADRPREIHMDKSEYDHFDEKHYFFHIELFGLPILSFSREKRYISEKVCVQHQSITIMGMTLDLSNKEGEKEGRSRSFIVDLTLLALFGVLALYLNQSTLGLGRLFSFAPKIRQLSKFKLKQIPFFLSSTTCMVNIIKSIFAFMHLLIRNIVNYRYNQVTTEDSLRPVKWLKMFGPFVHPNNLSYLVVLLVSYLTPYVFYASIGSLVFLSVFKSLYEGVSLFSLQLIPRYIGLNICSIEVEKPDPVVKLADLSAFVDLSVGLPHLFTSFVLKNSQKVGDVVSNGKDVTLVKG